MRKLIAVFLLIGLFGCGLNIGLKPSPDTTIPVEDTVTLLVALYIDSKGTSEGVHKVSDEIIKMSNEGIPFETMRTYLITEFHQSKFPFTAKIIMHKYLNGIMDSVFGKMTLWTDPQIREYIVKLATIAKQTADMYDKQANKDNSLIEMEEVYHFGKPVIFPLENCSPYCYIETRL